jgi:dCMP deaminase
MNQDAIWELVHHAAQESTCVRRRVGAVLVGVTSQLLSLGFNREAHGLRCDEGQCPRGRLSHDAKPSGTEPFDDCVAKHAEEVCLSDWLYTSLDGCTLYITDKPCNACQNYIVGNWPGLRVKVRGEGEFTCVSTSADQ